MSPRSQAAQQQGGRRAALPLPPEMEKCAKRNLGAGRPAEMEGFLVMGGMVSPQESGAYLEPEGDGALLLRVGCGAGGGGTGKGRPGVQALRTVPAPP